MQTLYRIVLVSLILPLEYSMADVPVFEPATCPFQIPANTEGLRCGYVEVSEDRSKPTGRRLRLAVAILESFAEDPQPDPLLYLTGGPGGGSLQYVPARLDNPFWNRYRQERDLVFFDQRGTGFSDPAFCLELDLALHASALAGLSLDEQVRQDLTAVEACRDKMLVTGIDFAQYSSASNALDIADLRLALGFEEWNVLGLSYGTRLALVTLREAPDGIRSVVLDSVYPPNAPVISRRANYSRSLRLAFDRCSEDPACRAAFPQLEEDFYAMLADYDTDPIEIAMTDLVRFPEGRIVVDGAVIAAGVYQGFYSGHFVELFPLLVRETRARNRNLLNAMANGLIRNPHSMRRGLNLSIQCRESVGRATLEQLAAERAAYPELEIWRGSANRMAHCDAWHQERAGAAFAEAVRSNIPTLLIAGDFDPISPPSFARLAKDTLSNGTLVVVPGEGHSVVPTSECTRDLVARFLASPDETPNTDCVTNAPEPRFITQLHMMPGISRLTSITDRPVLAAGGGIATLILISALVVWPIGWLWRRWRKHSVQYPGAAKRARWVAYVAALLALGFLAAIASAVTGTLAENPFILAFGLPSDKAWISVLPWLGLLATLGTTAFAVTAWRSHWWSTVARVHYTLIALAGLGFIACAAAIGLI